MKHILCAMPWWRSAAGLISLVSPQALSAALPEGFPVNAQNRSEIVIYSRTHHEMRSTVDRPTIEAVCKVSPEGKTPVFEPGFGEPVRTLADNYTSLSGEKQASYARIDFYNCDGAELKAKGLCGCTYKKQSERKVQVKIQGTKGRETWTAWLDRGDGRHELRAGSGGDQPPVPPSTVQDSVMGPVIEVRKVAGIPCELRRRNTPTIQSEGCRTFPDAALPEPVRSLMLSSETSTFEKGQLLLFSRLTTEQIDLATPVDAGVFNAPTGVNYKQRGAR